MKMVINYKIWTSICAFIMGTYFFILILFYASKEGDDKYNNFHSIISDHFYDIINNNFNDQVIPQPTEKWNKTNFASVAYFLMIAEGEEKKGIRLLQKILVNFNQYFVHLDKKMPDQNMQQVIFGLERLNQSYHNIYQIKSYLVNYRGISMVDVELTAMAFALETSQNWTHFINLSPTHYPLLTQFQISKLLGNLPQDLSFTEARISNCGYVRERMHPIYFDTAIAGKTTNQVPNTHQLSDTTPVTIFKASQWKLLSRKVVKYMVFSEDGLSRYLLTYFANTLIPDEHFFSTVICNSQHVHSLMRYFPVTYKNWDNINWKKRAEIKNWGPNTISLKHLGKALTNGGLFARKFGEDTHSRIAVRAIDKMLEGRMVRVGGERFTVEHVYNITKRAFEEAINGQTCQQMFVDDKKHPCKPRK